MINYSFYSEVYFGDKVSDDKQFNRLAGKAERLVAQKINVHVEDIIDENIIDMIKFTVCELIDYFKSSEVSDGVSSKSLGDYSVSFKDYSYGSTELDIINNNLSSTGLLMKRRVIPLGRL